MIVQGDDLFVRLEEDRHWRRGALSTGCVSVVRIKKIAKAKDNCGPDLRKGAYRSQPLSRTNTRAAPK